MNDTDPRKNKDLASGSAQPDLNGDSIQTYKFEQEFRALKSRIETEAASYGARLAISWLSPSSWNTVGLIVLRSEKGKNIIILKEFESLHTDFRVAYLELGVDSIFEKDLTEREEIAKLKALMRLGRGVSSDQAIINHDLVATSRILNVEDGQNHKMDLLVFTPTQSRLLLILVRHLDEVVHRDTLRESVVTSDGPTSRSLDIQVFHIRRRLSVTSVKLETVRGVGFKCTLNGSRKP